MKSTRAPKRRTLLQQRRPRQSWHAGAQGTAARRGLGLEKLEERQLLAIGPQLIVINPTADTILAPNDVLNVAPNNLTFRFDDNQQIDPETLTGIQITRAGDNGILGDADDVAITPGFIGLGSEPNEVIVRFAETLSDDLYNITILGNGPNALRNVDDCEFNDGVDFSLPFELDLGTQIVAVIPQPIFRSPVTGALEQNRDEIVVYFDSADLDPTSVSNPDFYHLIATQEMASRLDDGTPLHPTSVTYEASSPGGPRVTLSFAADIDQLAPGADIFRLRIGAPNDGILVPVEITPATDAGSSFDTASTIVGQLNADGVVLNAAIDPEPFALDLPGSPDDPGTRDLTIEFNTALRGAVDALDGISEIAYTFPDVYGLDPQDNQLRNVITETQKVRVREIATLYSDVLGVELFEADADAVASLEAAGTTVFRIVTGDLRALEPTITTGVDDTMGLAGEIENFGPTAILEAAESWDDRFGQNWFQEAMQKVGHLLGLGDTFDLPEGTIQGSDPLLTFGTDAEPVFPGDHDIVYGQYLHRPDSTDIDLYQFTINEVGILRAEVFAERLPDASLLDSVLRLYRDNGTSIELVAQNDDYFSQDSYLSLELSPGTYYIGISSTGNDQYDPTIEATGFGGTTQGGYQLRLDLRPQQQNTIVDTTQVALDGDSDNAPGGDFNFWFQAGSLIDTLFVDKSASTSGDGSLASPYRSVATAFAAATPGDIVRIVGNGGADSDLSTVDDNLAYDIGIDVFGVPLDEGTSLQVPQGVTAMIDEGAIFKLRRSVISVGSSSVTVDRGDGALQVLGTPQHNVLFTSANDQSIGLDDDNVTTIPAAGDWGGIVFQNDLDRAEGRTVLEDQGIFLNSVFQTDLRYGGGLSTLGTISQVIRPITMIDSRPTVRFNTVTLSSDAAMAATADSFLETNFHAPIFQTALFTSDYDRIGPEIRGNRVVDNTVNGMAVGVQRPTGNVGVLSVSGRWDDTQIVHVLSGDLTIQGTPGGAIQSGEIGTNPLRARLDASLIVDPGIVVKLDGTAIVTEIGATLLAEGTENRNVVFTSISDARFGGGGTFSTSNDDSSPQPGDWSGLRFEQTSIASLDHGVFAYGGGVFRTEGTLNAGNVVEVEQATARIVNSRFENNASGTGGQGAVNREGRGFNAPATIFVRGAQPIVVGNVFLNNDSPIANINANSMNHFSVTDYGRQTGPVDVITGFGDNQGPLIRRNLVENNSINAVEVRGGTLTTESVWDDTDVVHVLRDTIYVPDVTTYGGLRLESSTSESLVVKLSGDNAGFTATGRPLEIDDRIGGRVHLLGKPGAPVVLTSLADDTVGAGFDTQGRFQTDTDNFTRPAHDPEQFQIEVNYGPNIAAIPDAIEAFERAVEIWEETLNDPITIVLDVEFDDVGVQNRGFTTPVFVDTLGYDEVRDALIGDAGSHESIVSQLPDFENLQVNIPLDNSDPFTLLEQMRITRANAKALGFSADSLPAVASQFNPNPDPDVDTNIDATILLDPVEESFTDSNPVSMFDYDRQDDIQRRKYDFVGLALQQIGHALGFQSIVGRVSLALADADVTRDINLNTLDLFRLEPGAGQDDFTNAVRQIDPRFTEHVFYDGGFFDPTGIDIDQITVGDIPLVKGDAPFEITTTATHWLDDLGLNGQILGLMQPRNQLVGGTLELYLDDFRFDLKENDRRAFDLIGYDVAGGGQPGDWEGVRLEQASRDRNVQVINENEAVDIASSIHNDSTINAQSLGSLAPDLKSGDDNIRLGFEVHGMVRDSSDVDVYRFEAEAGTEVWLDIDRTSFTLDSVVELINAEEDVLARSDNSLAEGLGSELLVGLGAPLDSTDHYTINPRDAGMRVVLPGPTGTSNTYFVRVRSSSDVLASDLDGGLTQGTYQLQIRLQSVDEFAGSHVQYADIRYADVGVRVTGQPQHSELMGQVEDTSFNDLRLETAVVVAGGDDNPDIPRRVLPVEIGAQVLGNLLETDRGTLSVFGNLDTATDVDWYEFQISLENLQDIPGITDQGGFFDPFSGVDEDARGMVEAGVVFDIDHTGGFVRPDTALSIFDSTGTLIYFSDSSDVALDQLAAGELDFTDLSRGSISTVDPFIGPVVLEAGRNVERSSGGLFFDDDFFFDRFFSFNTTGTYYAAVSSARMVPTDVAFGGGTAPIIQGLTDRGLAVTSGSGIDTFTLNPDVPENAILSGEYQLEIRYTPVPVDGFDETNADVADSNRLSDQGQIIIESSVIRDSLNFNIVVEDAPRDLPEIIEVDPTDDSFRRIQSSSFAELRDPHDQFTNADYVPHASAIRSLVKINEERLVPGVTVKNNVLSNAVIGGIHVAGDPNGYVLRTYSLANIKAANDALGLTEFGDDDVDGTVFSIVDAHGHEEIFEFDTDGNVDAGHVIVRANLNPDDDGAIRADSEVTHPILITGTRPTFAFNITSEIVFAIESTDLDVEVFRPSSNEIYIDGAVAMPTIGGSNGSAYFPGDSFFGLITRYTAQQAAVPFAKVVNNTIVGRGGDLVSGSGAHDVGVLIEDNASPTLLNNIIANFGQALVADITSTDNVATERRTFVGFRQAFELQGFDAAITDMRTSPTKYVGFRPTVIAGNVVQGNLVNTVLLSQGDFALSLSNEAPLFQDPANGNYLLAAGSAAIDSAINSLDQRQSLESVQSAVGIESTDLVAPLLDQLGQRRVDDPSAEPPVGVGQNAFVDRGALDRADFSGLVATLVSPIDNDPAGLDQDAGDDRVILIGQPVSNFSIQLLDGVPPVDPGGTGADDNRVSSATVTVFRDGALLSEGVDYRFGYDTTANIIRLTPLTGVWPSDSTYEIRLDNSLASGIRDLAGNALQPNLGNETLFTIAMGQGKDFGDAPDVPYPTLNSSNGASHQIVEGFFLGVGVDAELDGNPSATADGDDLDDGVVFGEFLRGVTTTLTVTASTSGRIDAFVDFNGDGDWSDAGEQILDSTLVAAGVNELTTSAIPVAAQVGETFARIRFSSAGGLGPTGEAFDGEVEDYLVSIITSEWQNPNNPLDVDESGFVSPLDALHVVTEFEEFNFSDPADGKLITPRSQFVGQPGAEFLDVNGDGYVSPLDALFVVNGLDVVTSAPTSALSASVVAVNLDGVTIPYADQVSSSPLAARNATVDRAIAGLNTIQNTDDLPGVSRLVDRMPISEMPTSLATASTIDPAPSADSLDDVLDDIAADIGRNWQSDI